MDIDHQADKAWLLNIQRKLYAWSRSHPDEAWRDMWNWIIHPRNLRLAWRRVASNRGARTAGVDKVTVRRVRLYIGIDCFLADIQERLRNGSYRPSPVRRVMIPKRGKPGKFRPLGVPTVSDRVVQAAILNLLEPIFEAGFLTVSFGFRPKRACRDALEYIRSAILPRKVSKERTGHRPPYQWVIEGDIKGCFDNIDHHIVMVRLRRRVRDVKVCRLVRAFLKAGVLSEGAFLRSEAGTPQGGILSPLLANIVLSAIEEHFGRFVVPGRRRDGKAHALSTVAANKFRSNERARGKPVFLPVRYADDFVVLVSGTEEQARAKKEELARFLQEELKLMLSPEKTRITALTEGFQFLGHRVRLRWDDRWGLWPRLEIPKEKVKDLRYKVKQMTKRGHTHLRLQEVIDALNPVLLGWGRFYQHCYGAKNVFSRMDQYVWERVRRWLHQKHRRSSIREVHRRYWRRLGTRARFRWVDERPVVFVADLKVGRHNLAARRYPEYTWPGTGEPGA